MIAFWNLSAQETLECNYNNNRSVHLNCTVLQLCMCANGNFRQRWTDQLQSNEWGPADEENDTTEKANAQQIYAYKNTMSLFIASFVSFTQVTSLSNHLNTQTGSNGDEMLFCMYSSRWRNAL